MKKMPATSYTDYLRDLKRIIDRVRDRPFEYESALIQMAICKNGFGYKSRELLRGRKLYSEHHMGPLNVENWRPDDEELGRTEIDQFFLLPEIYAYSDHALKAEKNPLSTAHWDATVGIVEVLMCERNGKPMKQRMLFAGFSDRIHAEFFLAVDRDIIVRDHHTGSQLFEWQEDVTGDLSQLPFSVSQERASEGLRVRPPSRNWRSLSPFG